MIKTILTTTALSIFVGILPGSAQTRQGSSNGPKNEVKFLEDISVDVAPKQAATVTPVHDPKTDLLMAVRKEPVSSLPALTDIEAADKLQFKYALLLDTEVEGLGNFSLLKTIDEWFGVRYRLGGSTKEGIDCSALMQTFFTSIYRISLPRTAKEQYNISTKISRTELKEGDLVFFNTTGGVSHVGMYLQNNKFVHASSGGVTISDLYDEYWSKRFIGVGRVDENAVAALNSKP